MKAKIKVTNGNLYDSKIVDVDLALSVDKKGNGTGDVYIQWYETDNEGSAETKSQCWTGEHGSRDFEEEFGFIIEAEITSEFTNE